MDCLARFHRVLSRMDHPDIAEAAACWQISLSYVAQLKSKNR